MSRKFDYILQYVLLALAGTMIGGGISWLVIMAIETIRTCP